MYNQYRSLQKTLEDTSKVGTPDMPATMPPPLVARQSEFQTGQLPPRTYPFEQPSAEISLEEAPVKQEDTPSGSQVKFESLVSGQSEPDDAETQRMRTDTAIAGIDKAGRNANYRVRKAQNEAAATQEASALIQRKSGKELEKEARRQASLTMREYGRIDAEYQKGKQATDEYRAKMQSAITDMDAMSKRMAAEQPHDIWADSSTGVKVAAILMTGLGSAFQSFYGDKTNPVTDQIRAYIDRDLTMQRMRLEKNKDDFAMQNTLVGQMAKYTDNLQEAQQLATSVAMNGVQGRLQALKPLFQSKEHQATIDRHIADLANQSAANNVNVEATMGGRNVQMAEAVAELEAQRERAHAAANKPMTEYQRMKEERLNQAEQRKQNEFVVPGYHVVDAKLGPIGTPKEISEFRNKNAEAGNAIRSMDEVITILRSGAPLSWSAWQGLKSTMDRANLKLKGKDLFNGGAAFQKMEKELQASAFLGGSGETLTKLDPTAWKRIARARNDLLRDVRSAGSMLNLAPDEE